MAKFYAKRKEIKNSVTIDLLSIQVFDNSLDFKDLLKE